MASSVPHELEARSSAQSLLAQEIQSVMTAFLAKMDSQDGIQELGPIMDDEEDMSVFLELVAPLVRTNYQAHTLALESKLQHWVPEYQVCLVS
jgi:hypothetical protein